MLRRWLGARFGEPGPGPVLVVLAGSGLGGPVDRGGVPGAVQAEFAVVVGVEAMLAVGPLLVALPDLRLVGAGRRGDLGPRCTGFDHLMYEGGVAVVAGQHLARRQDLQVLGGCQRLVVIGVAVLVRVVGAAGLESHVRPRPKVPVSSSNRSRTSMAHR